MLLEARDLSVRFGGVQALRAVSFAVPEGAVFAIIGPNGAGKTTLFNVISRFITAEAGRLRFAGRAIDRLAPHRIAALGIARTFQNVELLHQATVKDNLLLGQHVHRRTGFLAELAFLGTVRRQEIRMRERADEVLDYLGLQRYRDVRVAELPYGTRKLVELGRALASAPRLLLLDEPAAGLASEDRADVALRIRDVCERRGVTVLMVEHDLGLVAAVSDHVLVLDHGVAIAEGTAAEVLESSAVVDAYLGPPVAPTTPW